MWCAHQALKVFNLHCCSWSDKARKWEHWLDQSPCAHLCVQLGRKSPQLDPLKTSFTLDLPVQAPPSSAPAPVGQRSQPGLPAAARASVTAAGSQKPPDLLEQRKGRHSLWTWSVCMCRPTPPRFSECFWWSWEKVKSKSLLSAVQLQRSQRHHSRTLSKVLLRTGTLTGIKLLVSSSTPSTQLTTPHHLSQLQLF